MGAKLVSKNVPNSEAYIHIYGWDGVEKWGVKEGQPARSYPSEKILQIQQLVNFYKKSFPQNYF